MTRTIDITRGKILLDGEVLHDFSHYTPDIRRSLIEEQVQILLDTGDGQGTPCELQSHITDYDAGIYRTARRMGD